MTYCFSQITKLFLKLRNIPYKKQVRWGNVSHAGVQNQFQQSTSNIQFSSVQWFSRVRLFAAPWIAAHQAPPSMGFSRQEYWSGVPLMVKARQSTDWVTLKPLDGGTQLGVEVEGALPGLPWGGNTETKRKKEQAAQRPVGRALEAGGILREKAERSCLARKVRGAQGWE